MSSGTRARMNDIVREKRGITPEMAIRLAKAFGGTPDIWVKMQLAYDLAHAGEIAEKIKVNRYPRPADTGRHH